MDCGCVLAHLIDRRIVYAKRIGKGRVYMLELLGIVVESGVCAQTKELALRNVRIDVSLDGEEIVVGCGWVVGDFHEVVEGTLKLHSKGTDGRGVLRVIC